MFVITHKLMFIFNKFLTLDHKDAVDLVFICFFFVGKPCLLSFITFATNQLHLLSYW